MIKETLNEYHKEFLACLKNNEVDYLVIGGQALATNLTEFGPALCMKDYSVCKQAIPKS